MLLGNTVYFDEDTVFQTIQRGQMNFGQVYQSIVNFIKGDTDSCYRISIGTDSQVENYTVFVSCIHVHRIGKGAIGFLHKSRMQRPLRNLREKIYMETCATLQLAYMFDDHRMRTIKELAGKNVDFEFHIDIGTKGETKSLINEMTGMVQGLDFVPKIKPDSYCASSFADKYTKAM